MLQRCSSGTEIPIPATLIPKSMGRAERQLNDTCTCLSQMALMVSKTLQTAQKVALATVLIREKRQGRVIDEKRGPESGEVSVLSSHQNQGKRLDQICPHHWLAVVTFQSGALTDHR